MSARWTFLVLSCLALPVAAPGCSAGPPNAIDVSTYPPEIQRRYALFANKCSRCHSLDRPIQAHVAKNGWVDYVRRMSRQPGAAITEAEQLEIAAFLQYHAEHNAESPR